MPAWALIITGLAAVIVAVGVIWTKAVKPAAKLITKADQALPVMAAMTDVFAGDTDIFLVIRAMAAEFRSDSGSTLRDVVNRLEQAAEANSASNVRLIETTDRLRVSSESIRELARDDRDQVAKLVQLLARLDERVVDAAALAVVVAENLEASHMRAEAAPVGAEPGEAADAAAQRPPDDG